jgi:deazaflavin-dependent oxidoreductase (nitroreductase family)
MTRATMAGSTADEFNSRVVAEFRANAGRVGGPLAGTPIILVHHIGAKSGIERVTPLACSPQGDRRYGIVASNGGSPTHPGWYYNLKANPTVKVEFGAETFMVLAEELKGPARDALWPELVAASPSLHGFQATAARHIPLFMLTRAD